MDRAGADRADRYGAAVRHPPIHPPVEVGGAERLLGHRPHGVGLEHGRQLLERGSHQRCGQVGPLLGARQRFLEVLILAEHEVASELGQVLDDLDEAQLL